MKKTLVLLISYRGSQALTRECTAELVHAGARTYGIEGTADIALSRSWLLSSALRLAEKRPDVVDTFLCIDDDMAFNINAAQALVDESRRTGEVVSAVYATSKGSVAASRYGGRWLAGFGFLAVPVAQLQRLKPSLPSTLERDEEVSAWCQSGPHPKLPGRWISEDYWFCLHWDGVLLAPIGVGHIKAVPLYPDEATLRALAAPDSLSTQRAQPLTKLTPQESEPRPDTCSLLR